MSRTSIGHLLQGGPVHSIGVVIALVLLVVAAGIWLLEFSGRTITRRGIVRNGLRWNARTISLIAVCAAIYIAGRPLQIQFIPGIGGFNPSLSLGPVLAVLFGLPGAIGVTFSMPIGDAISGALTIGSVAGFLGHTFYTWIAFKLLPRPSLRKLGVWVRLYAAVLLGGLLNLITICGWLDFTHSLPPNVVWTAVAAAIAINQIISPAIVVPILLAALYPLVRQWGLFHETYTPKPRRRAAQAAAEPEQPGGPPVVVRLEGLRFRYPSGDDDALRGIDLTVRRGEMVGVIGRSGAGKSTLCQAVKGLIPHSTAGEVEGSVTVFGTDLLDEHRVDVGARIGLVLQDPEAQIIGMTVAEDLAFGPENYELDPETIAERSARCLELVGLTGLMQRDTYALSGGQKQRLAIASALMLEPDLLILDEPTSELDPLGKDQVFEILRGLRAAMDVTVIIVEHEVDRLVQLADRVVVLADGAVVADDVPLNVFTGPEVHTRTGGERLPAAAEFVGRLAAEPLFAGLRPTLELDDALGEVTGVLEAAR